MGQMTTLKLPLNLEAHEIVEIDRRLLAHGMLYNAVIKAYLKRIDEYRSSPISQLKYSKPNQAKKQKLKQQLGLSKFDVIKLAGRIARDSKNDLYDGLTVNQTAERAYKACQDYLITGKNKPVIKNPYHNHTVYGSGSRQNLRLVKIRTDSLMRGEQELEHSKRKRELVYETLQLGNSQKVKSVNELIISWSNRALPRHRHLRLLIDWRALSSSRREWLLANINHLRQVGITRGLIRGEWKYYCLIVLKTKAYRSEEYATTGRSLGIDTGPMQSHGVDDQGEVFIFTPGEDEIEKYQEIEKRIASKKRKLDRTRRGNPVYQANYNPDGTINKGIKFDPKLRSNNAKKLGQEIAELSRKRQAVRQELIRKTVKELARDYDTIIVEKVNYSVWQRRYGKSMNLNTPGFFQQLLGMELSRHDKKLIQMPLNYAFSQSCVCGNKVKKKLSDRIHKCENKECPIYDQKHQRDQFSAFLMRVCHEYQLTPVDLHAGKLLSKLSVATPIGVRTTIETLLPPRLAQANPVYTLLISRLAQDAVIYNKQNTTKNSSLVLTKEKSNVFYHK
jgi:hypothetical protein